MTEDNYVELLLQKYRLAVALAVLRNKPDNISVEGYITDMRNKIRESELQNSLTNLGVDEDDFNISNSDISIISLSLNINEENSNDSVTILKDFDYNLLIDTGNENSLNEVGQTLKNSEDQQNGNLMLTENIMQIDNIIQQQSNKEPIDNDLKYSENDIQLRLRVENNLQRDVVERSDIRSQSLIPNIQKSQETDYNLAEFTENYTHFSQSQDNVTIQKNLFNNKRKFDAIEIKNNKKLLCDTNDISVSVDKSTINMENIECDDGQNDLISQSVQMHIPKKLKPILYTEDTSDAIDCLDNISATQNTFDDNKSIGQATLFSPEDSLTNSIFPINSNDYHAHQNSSENFQNDLHNHISLDFSFENTLFSQKRDLNKENICDFSQTQSFGGDILDSPNDIHSLKLNKINSHTSKCNDKRKTSNNSINSLSENIKQIFTKDKHLKEDINEKINERDDSNESISKKSAKINESSIYSSQDSFGFLSAKRDAINELNSDNEIEFSNQEICKINRVNESDVAKKGTNESRATNDLTNERIHLANERQDLTNETNAMSSDDEMINDLSVSQSEVVPFKVMEELSRIKTFLNRSDLVCSESRSDSGYKSSSRVSITSASQSGLWLNQSSHSLFSYISQTSLLVSTMDINHEIAKVLGELIDRLHEDEKYPTFLDEMLEFIANLLVCIYKGTSSDENVFLKNNESIDRLILLNKSTNIIKFTIENIIKILESFYEDIHKGETIELEDVNKVENLSYIFHLLEILLKKCNSTKLSQTQSQDEKVLKRSTLTQIWRKQWNLSKSDDVQKEEKPNVYANCSDILNKIVVKTMDGYSLVAYAALQCFNLLQS